MNWTIMSVIYCMFHAIHGVADYWVQTDWQAKNKSKNWKALWTHVLTYSLCFVPVSILLHYSTNISKTKLLLLPVVIGLCHAFMDQRKFLNWFLFKTKGWGPADFPAPPEYIDRTHVTIHMDQKYHYLCLLLTAIWIAW